MTPNSKKKKKLELKMYKNKNKCIKLKVMIRHPFNDQNTIGMRISREVLVVEGCYGIEIYIFGE